ncbi:MAG: hypothetical protein KJS83_11315 [Xanthomonadaceae bacterium]|nr:hypothetical protein [Xanthomonadaceae bacterium]
MAEHRTFKFAAMRSTPAWIGQTGMCDEGDDTRDTPSPGIGVAQGSAACDNGRFDHLGDPQKQKRP